MDQINPWKLGFIFFALFKKVLFNDMKSLAYISTCGYVGFFKKICYPIELGIYKDVYNY